MVARKFIAGSMLAGVAVIASPAFAQDAGPYFDGFYIGGSVSADTADDSRNDRIVFDTDRDGEFDDFVRTGAGADAFSPGFCRGNAGGSTRAVSCGGNDLEVGYAVRAGFDSRMGDGPLVAGVLVEAAKPGVEDFTTAFSTTPASYTIEREIDYSVMARGRLGISPGDGRGLFYVTGGVGFARLDHTFTTTNGANSFTPSNERDWQFGGQVGGGAELMLTRNIGLGLEYLYSSYEDEDYSVAVGQGTAPATNPFLLRSGGTDLRNGEDRFDYHSFKATLNFHF
jgi:outer membrane immunogenic protein